MFTANDVAFGFVAQSACSFGLENATRKETPALGLVKFQMLRGAFSSSFASSFAAVSLFVSVGSTPSHTAPVLRRVPISTVPQRHPCRGMSPMKSRPQPFSNSRSGHEANVYPLYVDMRYNAVYLKPVDALRSYVAVSSSRRLSKSPLHSLEHS